MSADPHVPACPCFSCMVAQFSASEPASEPELPTTPASEPELPTEVSVERRSFVRQLVDELRSSKVSK
jgi:hypothetical protein